MKNHILGIYSFFRRIKNIGRIRIYEIWARAEEWSKILMVTDDLYKYKVRNTIPNNWTILTDDCDKIYIFFK